MEKTQQLANLKMIYQSLSSELNSKVAKQRFLITFNRIFKSFMNNEITFGICLAKISDRFINLSNDAFV